jgi:hypothetical protein
MLPRRYRFLQTPPLQEMLFATTAFTAGNTKTQVIESKHVINRELWVVLQFPIGDDVSAYTRCEAA